MLFQLASHAQSQHPFFVVMKNNALVQGGKCSDSIDSAQIWRSVKDEGSAFTQNRLAVRHHPVQLHSKFAAIFATRRLYDAAMHDRSHFALLLRWQERRTVPEIDAVDVAVVQPEAGVMWVVDALAGSRLQRKSSRDKRTFGG